MLGMMHYLLRVMAAFYEDHWPERGIELGVGYGVFSYIFCLTNPAWHMPSSICRRCWPFGIIFVVGASTAQDPGCDLRRDWPRPGPRPL
jgi:hypothetical protein